MLSKRLRFSNPNLSDPHHWQYKSNILQRITALLLPLLPKMSGVVGFFPTTISLPSHAKSQLLFPSPKKLHNRHGSGVCRATYTSSSSESITEYDLYDLLGIDSSSDQSQIKYAYRSLQKRCHPDIAGPTGHDMAIVLNEAYSVLSDPISRSIYDKEQAKISEFNGYTGKPLYSTWVGSENERRAVFVDEVKCVGCLKCALFASNTFAVESVYGRARVVAQWADPEDKIIDAIQTCPVDCISIVERSDLAALEFLMSKQPRGNVRLSSGNTAGVRVSNIFADIEKFQKKFQEMKEKATKKKNVEPDLHSEARYAAMQAIRAIANWIYWKATKSAAPAVGSWKNLMITAAAATETREQQHPVTERLRQATARRRTGDHRRVNNSSFRDEYWTPTLVLPSPSKISNNETSSSHPKVNNLREKEDDGKSTLIINMKEDNPTNVMVPVVIAFMSSIVVGYESGNQTGVGLKEHIGGIMALQIVNSSEMQMVLAGITWYVIGAAVVGLVRIMTTRRD